MFSQDVLLVLLLSIFASSNDVDLSNNTNYLLLLLLVLSQGSGGCSTCNSCSGCSSCSRRNNLF